MKFFAGVVLTLFATQAEEDTREPCFCSNVVCLDDQVIRLIPGTETNCCGGDYECVQKVECSPMMCMIDCPHGNLQDENGCDTCGCQEAPAQKEEQHWSYNCLTRELWSKEKTEWCCANKNLGCPPKQAVKQPRACCKALTAECIACEKDISIESFCNKEGNEGVPGCDRYHPTTPSTLNKDTHECLLSAGYMLCQHTGHCIRPWEHVDELDANQDGKVSVEEFEAACNDAQTDPDPFGVFHGMPGPVLAQQPTTTTTAAKKATRVGSNQDDNGCIHSAGYRWCAARNECIRPWEYVNAIDADEDGAVSEEEFGNYCNAMPVGSTRDTHGCIASAGYQWCESDNECLRIWEETAKMDKDGDGSVSSDEFDSYCSGLVEKQDTPLLGAPTSKCLSSAGYQWCEGKEECIRWFEHKEEMDQNEDGEVTELEVASYCSTTTTTATTTPTETMTKCVEDAHCPTGQICYEQTACIAQNTLGDTVTDTDTPAPVNKCDTDTDCPMGEICYEQTACIAKNSLGESPLTTKCAADSDCPMGQICYEETACITQGSLGATGPKNIEMAEGGDSVDKEEVNRVPAGIVVLIVLVSFIVFTAVSFFLYKCLKSRGDLSSDIGETDKLNHGRVDSMADVRIHTEA